jgi:hypothetical protein
MVVEVMLENDLVLIDQRPLDLMHHVHQLHTIQQAEGRLAILKLPSHLMFPFVVGYLFLSVSTLVGELTDEVAHFCPCTLYWCSFLLFSLRWSFLVAFRFGSMQTSLPR